MSKTVNKLKIKLYTPHPNQRPAHVACEDDNIFFITINAGRQSGKTALGQQQALKWALANKNCIIYWVAPTAGQALKSYKQILKQIKGAPIVKSNKGSQGDTEIVFRNGAAILFRSAAQRDSLRGETIDYLIVDEASFVEEEIFQEVLLPMLNVRGKKCLLISTPKGKNYFWKMYKKGIDGEPSYVSFKFTSSDNPHSSPRVIEIAKSELPRVLFEQEYLAHFVDNSSIIENVEELCSLELIGGPVEGDKYFIGIDVALKNDYNVVAIYNQKHEMVFFDRVNNITAPLLKERLIKIFDKWKPKAIYIEENNQGLPILQDLKDTHKVKNIYGWVTSSTSKPIIVNQLINAFASKKIKAVNDEVLKAELSIFTMEIGSTGKPRYAAPRGYNDDIPMAMAIGWQCLMDKQYSGEIGVMKISLGN